MHELGDAIWLLIVIGFAVAMWIAALAVHRAEEREIRELQDRRKDVDRSADIAEREQKIWERW